MSKKTRLERRRDSRLGRLLCRLLGEEKGAVMMEYVILAVLIAAAAVVAVAMFGKTIVGMFDTAGKGATADHAGAKQALEAARLQQNGTTNQCRFGVPNCPVCTRQTGGSYKANRYHDSMHK